MKNFVVFRAFLFLLVTQTASAIYQACNPSSKHILAYWSADKLYYEATITSVFNNKISVRWLDNEKRTLSPDKVKIVTSKKAISPQTIQDCKQSIFCVDVNMWGRAVQNKNCNAPKLKWKGDDNWVTRVDCSKIEIIETEVSCATEDPVTTTSKAPTVTESTTAITTATTKDDDKGTNGDVSTPSTVSTENDVEMVIKRFQVGSPTDADSSTVSYQQQDAFCKSKGGRLPTLQELCPSYNKDKATTPALGCENSHSWVPYAGNGDQWMFIGCPGTEIGTDPNTAHWECKDHMTHYGRPVWSQGDQYGDMIDCMVVNTVDEDETGKSRDGDDGPKPVSGAAIAIVIVIVIVVILLVAGFVVYWFFIRKKKGRNQKKSPEKIKDVELGDQEYTDTLPKSNVAKTVSEGPALTQKNTVNPRKAKGSNVDSDSDDTTIDDDTGEHHSALSSKPPPLPSQPKPPVPCISTSSLPESPVRKPLADNPMNDYANDYNPTGVPQQIPENDSVSS